MTMKVDWSFPKQVALALLVVACAGAYPLIKYATLEVTKAVLMGAFLATLNVLVGYAAIEYSTGKSMATFFRYVLGGMGLRMILMAVALVLLIKVFDFHAAALAWSIGSFYVVFLSLEVVFLQKKFNHK